MNYKGAVFFDYDGTLADEANGIFLPTEATVNSVKKLKEKGLYIIPLKVGIRLTLSSITLEEVKRAVHILKEVIA